MKNFALALFALISLFSAQAQTEEPRPLGLMLEDYKYPFSVSTKEFDIQGQKLIMAYMDVKPASPNGKTIMLLHGKNFSGAYWEQTAADLSKDGYRVIIPDQIGFGKSSKPTNIQYSFQLLAQNTKAILDELKITKLTVLGHSMGGMVATRFALMYPTIVEKLVLENPIGLEDWKLWVPYQSVDDWYAGELKQDFEKLKMYQVMSYYHSTWRYDYNKWLYIPAGWTMNKEIYPTIAKNAALTYDMIFTQPVCYEFQNLKMPVLLIIGQLDRTALGKAKAPADVQLKLGNYPVLGKETAKKIPNAKLVKIEGVGHLPHIEAYEEFIAPLKEFLKG
jgi:pimeloyl-ACP methyl ester carboxylesterase